MRRAVKWIAGIAVVALAVYVLAWPHLAVRLGYAFAAGAMPRCDAPFTASLLVKTINNSPAARTLGLEVTEVRSAGTDIDTGDDRVCRADVMSNIGRRQVEFTLQWDGAARDRLLLQAKPWW